MPTLKEQIVDLLERSPGLTDREITNVLKGASAPQQPANIACRELVTKGVIDRRKRHDGLIGNALLDKSRMVTRPRTIARSQRQEISADDLSEDEVKSFLAKWLEDNGWQVEIAWGKARGVDVHARKDRQNWFIEVKGCGSRQAMRVNYFLAILGETLQRMSDPDAKYSIVLPDMPQFRGLWERLPMLAKERTKITAIFVTRSGEVLVAPSAGGATNAGKRLDA